jgi:hypothetical protein
MTLLPIVVLLYGCAPQDAEVTADYAVYLAAASSENINRLERTGIDVEAAPEKYGLEPIDCRILSGLEDDEAIDAARLDGVDYGAECCTSGSGEECDTPIQPRYFSWLDDYAYFLHEGKVDAWRTEAVLTREGDLQLTVHMDIAKLGDFRFGWVIDPDFAPTLCVDGENGAEEVADEGDWLTLWSEGLDKGKLWHLNAGSFQINPSNEGIPWYFAQEWQAGYSFARFADEEFYGHATDYSDEYYRPFYVDAYGESSTYSCGDAADTDGDGLGDGADPDCEVSGYEGASIPAPKNVNPDERYANWVENVEEFFASDVTDLADIGKSDFPFQVMVEDNSGRPVDGTTAGFDGWLGVSPSWVRIDNPEDIKLNPDKPITGEFQVYLEGVAAASKMLVRGSFTINNVRDDVWGYYRGTLEEVKAEENNTPTCGEERLTTELEETEG